MTEWLTYQHLYRQDIIREPFEIRKGLRYNHAGESLELRELMTINGGLLAKTRGSAYKIATIPPKNRAPKVPEIVMMKNNEGAMDC